MMNNAGARVIKDDMQVLFATQIDPYSFQESK